MTRICIAGVTGWVGRALAPAIHETSDMTLVGAVARRAAGQSLAALLGGTLPDVTVHATVAQALETPTDVLVDFTSSSAVKQHTLDAVTRGVHVVIGSSGLSAADFEDIDRAARRANVGVLAAGNFAITAVLLQHFAMLAARHIPAWEIIDYASAQKPDAPSGTARELAFRLSRVRQPAVEVPIASTRGNPEARGLTLDGTQVHSIRLPGTVIGAEVLFGRAGERLSLRYDGTDDPAPYVHGTIVACRHVGDVAGLRRGLDSVLEL